MYYSSNVFYIDSGIGGTGTYRATKITSYSGAIGITVDPYSPNGVLNVFGSTSQAAGIGLKMGMTYASSSGVIQGAAIVPTINQSSTAGYTALLINPTETTTGSGAKLLIDAQVGGVSLATVNNQGDISSESIQSFDRQPAGNVSIPANFCSVVVGRYSIASGKTLTIGSGAVLAIIN